MSDAVANHPPPWELEAKKYFRRNYLAHSVEGGVFIGAMSFLAADTVMPTMIKSLGGSNWIISLMPMMSLMGFMWPPMLTAHWVERLPRVMPFVMIMGFFQRLPYIFAALGLFCWAGSHGAAVLALVALTPLLSGSFGGISGVAWMELVSKTIPPQRQSSLYAIRSTIGAVMGLAAGGIIVTVLHNHPGPSGYGILHLIASFFLFVSFAVFSTIKEPGFDFRNHQARKNLAENLRSVPALVRQDLRMRNFILMRIFSAGFYIMSPFLAIHAIKTLGRDESYVGYLVSAQMLGGVGGNILAGYLGDRYGGKLLIVLSRHIFIAVSLGAAFNIYSAGFAAIFFLFGAAFNMNMIGNSTLSIEICPLDRRPTYLALLSSTTAPSMLAAAAIGTLVRNFTLGIMPAALLSACFMAMSLYFVIRIKEPRLEKSGQVS